MFWLTICLCTMCVPDAWEVQKKGAQELLQKIVWMLGPKPRYSARAVSDFLNSESSLSNSFYIYFYKLKVPYKNNSNKLSQLISNHLLLLRSLGTAVFLTCFLFSLSPPPPWVSLFPAEHWQAASDPPLLHRLVFRPACCYQSSRAQQRSLSINTFPSHQPLAGAGTPIPDSQEESCHGSSSFLSKAMRSLIIGVSTRGSTHPCVICQVPAPPPLLHQLSAHSPLQSTGPKSLLSFIPVLIFISASLWWQKREGLCPEVSLEVHI